MKSFRPARIAEVIREGKSVTYDMKPSRDDPSAVGTSDARTQDALRTGNAEYERRFGYVFLIRAAGRSAEEMVTELDRRLANDEGRERAEVTEQLAQITRLRVATLLAG